ncbi:hypothetical protein BC829DRAFT_91258 [Chytridium lagenaria]|nr:hypothetical protein BC829DRAFT_91258 [Chytridium lagenaria]
MNLDDFFGSPWASSCLRTEHSWSYHVNSARILVTNSSDTFFASVSSTSEISIFSISNIPSPSRILTYLCDLEHDNVTNACWLPEVPYLLISDEDRNLAVYKWDGNVVLKVGETHVMDDASIDSLRAIRDPNTKNYSIVAVTKSGNICAWKFDLQGP